MYHFSDAGETVPTVALAGADRSELFKDTDEQIPRIYIPTTKGIGGSGLLKMIVILAACPHLLACLLLRRFVCWVFLHVHTSHEGK